MSSGLFGLPAELRKRIWRLAVVDAFNSTTLQALPRVPGIIRTCQQSRREAIGMWLLESTFKHNIQDYDATWLCAHYKAIATIISSAEKLGAISETHYNSIKMMVSHSGAPNWRNLLKSVEAYYRDGEGTMFLTGKRLDEKPAELKVFVAAFVLAKSMRGKPWVEVAQALESWHVAIAAMDDAWS
ncbi:hypothetical protein LTR56_026319 [Elasticomyces elasticus]|nr:hypothetical protein LTR56_026319 [Elasticomyces elasticus]KAK3649101.1 hypothetical protein LTR22_013071 [Elasticomyces elasticus]KAK4901970.1 hypothetical protein LTR49_027116 [Elasticomyces elasticus]KAK5747939.1 hypothetical protein LTS12_021992 [Elasticomyces elasticus]